MPKRTGRGGGGCTGAAEDDIGGRCAAALVGLGSVCGVIVCVFRVQDNQDSLGSLAHRTLVFRLCLLASSWTWLRRDAKLIVWNEIEIRFLLFWSI
jgi:hypothetical protein